MPMSSWRWWWHSAGSSRLSLLDRVPMVNLHFSLLPRWRGAAPVERAILAGDERDGRLPHEGRGGARHRSGVRLPFAAHATICTWTRCAPSWSTWEPPSWSNRWPAGRRASRFPSPSAAPSTIAPKVIPDELRLRWDEPAAQLHRVVRLGRAWTTFRGRRLGILRATPVTESAGRAGAARGPWWEPR